MALTMKLCRDMLQTIFNNEISKYACFCIIKQVFACLFFIIYATYLRIDFAVTFYFQCKLHPYIIIMFLPLMLKNSANHEFHCTR